VDDRKVHNGSEPQRSAARRCFLGSGGGDSRFANEDRCRLHKNELSEAIAPLIDQAALLVNETLAAYIRENGGWAAFALVFKSPKKDGSWAKKALAAVSVIFAVYDQLYFK
jgi:hypothetical protein